MKRYIIIAVFAFLFTSCEKEDTGGVSKETTYASFTMEGDEFMSIIVGGSYTEPGVTAKEGDTDLEVKISGTVDPTKVGAYDLVYSAVNKDGFPGSVTRKVIVLPSADNADISGKYKYATSAVVATIVKLAPGFYSVDNVWGPNDIGAYIITSDGENLLLPLRNTAYGRVTGTGTLTGTSLSYKINLLDQGISNNTRNWVKQ